uniref:Uncharacterized protein n=1 Tax=Anopheles atroparvus TaxID=41427 RepID=A0AAG5DUD6_ANOAO
MSSVVDKHMWKIFHDHIIRSYFSADNTKMLTKINQSSNLCFASPRSTAVSISFGVSGKTWKINSIHCLHRFDSLKTHFKRIDH